MAVFVKRVVKTLIISIVIILVLLGLRSCVLSILSWKNGLFQYKVNFWDANESFDYLANMVDSIFDESKKAYPEIERIVVDIFAESQKFRVSGLDGNDEVFEKMYSVSEECIYHYEKVNKVFKQRDKNEGLFSIDAYEGQISFVSYVPYAIIRRENGTPPRSMGLSNSKDFYAERISFRWFHGTYSH